jgi:uncharacterized protein (TIGR04255 family)
VVVQNSPPAVEVGVSVQFVDLSALTVIDLASIFERFREGFPTAVQVPPLQPITVEPMEPTIQFGNAMELPRMWFCSADNAYIVQLQQNRLGLNWRLIDGDAAAYPGYDAFLDKFREQLDVLLGWLSDGGRAAPLLEAGELFYMNMVPLHVDGGTRRLTEVFSFFRQERQLGIAGFHTIWSEPMQQDYRGHVQVMCGVGHRGNDVPAATAQLSARFSLQECSIGEALSRFDAAHRQIHDVLPYIIEKQFLGPNARL